MLANLLGVIAAGVVSSAPSPLTIQAEKLRMNVLELREISRSERRRNGGIFAIIGAGLIANAAIQLAQEDPRFWAAPDARASNDLSFGLFGALLIGVGAYNLFTAPFEDGLWDALQALKLEDTGDAAIFLAEGEARYEAAVQRAAFWRKATGALFIFGSVTNFAVHLGAAQSAPRPTPPGVANPRDPGNFMEGEVIDIAGVALGVWFIFGVKTASERAWAAYLNDKNLQRPPPIALMPQLMLGKGYAGAGVTGAF